MTPIVVQSNDAPSPASQPALPSFYLTGDDASAISQETYVLRNPNDGSIEADQEPIAGSEDVDAAVKYAEEAFNRPWSKFSAMQRTTCFYKLIELLENRFVEIPTLTLYGRKSRFSYSDSGEA